MISFSLPVTSGSSRRAVTFRSLDILSDHLLPSRVGVLRLSTHEELDGTKSVAQRIEITTSVRTAPPQDAEADLDPPIRADVVLLSCGIRRPETAPHMRFEVDRPVCPSR